MKKLAQTGFSLIELLVVVAVSLILLNGAISALTGFNERRSVTNAVDELKTIIQTAQSKARSGDLGGCTKLSGYQLQTYLNNNVTEVSLQAVCVEGTANDAQIQILPVRVTVTPNLNAIFQVLNAGVLFPDDEGAWSVDLTVTNDTHNYLIVLYREGRIGDTGWQ